LRDFFAEVPSRANETIPPADVQKEIDEFTDVAKKSGKAFLNIADKDMYWYVFRNWQLKKGRQYVYNIENVYKSSEENSCVIFPRKKGNTITPNNGGPWDYLEIAKLISPYFDKVYITGHPSMSAELKSEGNIEVCLSTDNKVVIEKCCNASLIITQHSGAVNIGCYTNTPVLIIFNSKPPIKGLIDTIRFRKNLTSQKLNYAFNTKEIVEFVTSLNKN
jgi:ADP-heptose:LPS heptosyltransferase